MTSKQLAYISSSDKYHCLRKLLSKDWAMLLDSGTGINQPSESKAQSYRRYDICVCRPSIRLTVTGDYLTIDKIGQDTSRSRDNPLLTMRALLREYSNKTTAKVNNIPFNGGWLGYISYDFASERGDHDFYNLHNSRNQIKNEETIPSMRMGLYQWALISDHVLKITTMYNFGLSATDWSQLKLKIIPLLQKPVTKSESKNSHFYLTKPFKSNLNYQEYSCAFQKIQNYIYAGDCYQVNFAQKFSSSFVGNPFDAYILLARENNSPFSAYLNFPEQQIISLSPERFIESKQGEVVTQPIKGTLPRDPDPIKDQQLAQQLLNSEKDKAENLMIVDLLRNDLSKTAAKASVKVTELFGHYQFESVHHLISTIKSKLDRQYDNFDLLETTFPGGSITGAPKIRAMQIIDELETAKRGIYCGVIGYIDFDGNMDTNICIRTLITDKNNIHCWAGGGLVADSQLDLEYQETFDKLNKILPVLNSTVPNNYPNVNTLVTH